MKLSTFYGWSALFFLICFAVCIASIDIRWLLAAMAYKAFECYRDSVQPERDRERIEREEAKEPQP